MCPFSFSSPGGGVGFGLCRKHCSVGTSLWVALSRAPVSADSVSMQVG